MKLGSRRKRVTHFFLRIKERAKKRNILIEFIDNDILIGRRVLSGQSVCAGHIVWCGQRGRIICVGIGHLAISQKN